MKTRVLVVLVVCVLAVGAAAEAGTVTYDITAYIDDHDLLIIQGDTLQWHHLAGAAVGRWGGANEPTVVFSTVNGTAVMPTTNWIPIWPQPVPDENREDCFSSVLVGLVPPLMAGDVTVTVQAIDTRTAITIEQQPSEANGYTLIVDFTDYVPEPYWCHVAIVVEYSWPFWDVPSANWAFGQVGACAEAGIVTGYWDGSYRPGLTVNRAQMAVYVARAMAGGDEAVPPGLEFNTFPDVGLTHWAYKYVEYCADQGVVTGYPDGGYHPDEVVNRGQMAVYVARAVATPTGDAGVPDLEPDAQPTFTDVPGQDSAWEWCWKYVEYCAAHGIVEGYAGNVYHPEREVTRDQMAVYVARAFELPY